MAKTPETRDRYRIHAETSLEQMGYVLAAFTKMGLDNIGYELITDVAKYKEKAPRANHKTTSAELIREYVKENATFPISDMIKHFKVNNRTEGAAAVAVSVMVKNGELKKLGGGNYQSAKVKALPAPAKKAKTVKTRETSEPRARYDVSNKEIILRYLFGRNQISAAALVEYFKQNERQPKSVGAVLTMLGHQKILKNRGQGVWDVTAKGIKAATAARSAVTGPVQPAEAHMEQANG